MDHDSSQKSVAEKQPETLRNRFGFTELCDWITRHLAARAGLAPSDLDPAERFQRLGLDSIGAAAMLRELGSEIGRPLAATLVWEYPTPEALARHLVGADRAVRHSTGPLPTSGSANEPIAIIGMACRFPKAPNPAAFWRLLHDGIDAVSEVPSGRWPEEIFAANGIDAAERMKVRRGGFLDQIDRFDPLFFGISPREAVSMDPQQRLLLELVWEALEDAGIRPSSLQQSRTGVFAGAVWADYGILLHRDGLASLNQHTITGYHHAIIANRISYFLGVQGPSFAIDSACSSGLVGVHLACESLRRGESTTALVAAANLHILPESAIGVSRLGALSPDGRCYTFDARANGYARGEGAAVLVLKSLSRAIAEGDSIYCVIRGSTVNNDGPSNGLTAPNPRAQEALLRDAYRRAGVSPSAVQYLEAHGTGTPLGDPIETGAIGAVLGADRVAERPLLIGSAKTNVGHLEGASGLVGLIKVALAIKHRLLPPSLNFESVNPHIPLAALGLAVPTALGPWPVPEQPLTAGISSFGLGGTNSHLVVQEWPAVRSELFAIAAKTQDGLRRSLEAERTKLASDAGRTPLAALCAEAASSWGQGADRWAVVVRTHEELARALAASVREEARPAGQSSTLLDASRGVVFVFPGMGAQWRGMALSLLQGEPVFRSALQRCDEHIRRLLGWSLFDELTAEPASSRVDDVEVSLPAVISIDIAICAYYRSVGIAPTAVVGHSAGEVAAAHVAGALDLSDAMKIVCAYGRLLGRMAGQGRMALVGLSWEQAERAIDGFAGRVFCAIQDSTTTTVLAGEPAAMDALIDSLSAKGVFCRPVATNASPHCPLVDSLRAELLASLQRIKPRRSSIPLFSEVTGTEIDGALLGPQHWVKNFGEPVFFARAVNELIGRGHRVFVDVGPHPITKHAVETNLRSALVDGLVLSSMRRGEDERGELLDTLGKLYTLGAPLRPDALAPQGSDPGESADDWLLPLSAKTPEALATLARAYIELLEQPAGNPRLGDIVYTASVGREHHAHRLVAVGRTRAELCEALRGQSESAAQGQSLAEARPGPRNSTSGKLAFLFTGQGAQQPGMGRGLHAVWPAFSEAFDRCVTLFDRELTHPLGEVMWAEPGSASEALLHQTAYTQPALFALEYALYELWRSWDVTPDFVAGHSIGELVAACVAGVFSLEDATRLCAARGRLMQVLPAGGAMVSIAAPEAEVATAVAPHCALVSIAAINEPQQVVIAGAAEPVQAIAAAFAARGVPTRPLRVSHAFHSPLMEPMLAEFARVAESCTYRPPRLPLVSTVSGQLAADAVHTPDYWVRQVRQTVRFADGVTALHAAGVRTFIELGPKPVLLGLVADSFPPAKLSLYCSLRAGRTEAVSMLEALGGFWAAGGRVDWAALFPAGGRRVPAPTYPWQRERYWVDSAPLQSPMAVENQSVAAEYYDALARVDAPAADRERTDFEEAYLTFGPFPEIVPGFSWVSALAADKHEAHAQIALKSQRELRAISFRHVDFARINKVLDFGCGYATDLLVLGKKYPHLELNGYTISAEQANVGGQRARVLGLGNRVGIYHRDSAKNPFPDLYDLVFGFEVAHHIRDKQALFANIGGHLRPQGLLVLADFVSNTSFEIEHEQSSSFFLMKDQWVELLTKNQLRLVDCVDVSQQIANFLHDPSFASNFERLQQMSGDSHIRTANKSYDQLGRLLRRGLASYVLLTARKDEGVARDELQRLNRQALAEMLPYAAFDARGARRSEADDWFLQIDWDRAAVPAPKVTAGRYLLLGADAGCGAGLHKALVDAGHAVVSVASRDLGSAALGPQLTGAFAPQAPTAVVHLGASDADGLDPESIERALVAGCDSVLATVQALAGQGYRDAPRLWIVTRGAQAIGQDPVAVAQTPLLGLCRVIAMEHAELRCTLVDLDPGCPADGQKGLLAELLADDAEEEIALRGDERRVARLRHQPPEVARTEQTQPASGRPFRLEIDEPGLLHRLVARAVQRRAPGPGEVEIAAAAAGLGYIDVMQALGNHPGSATGPLPLGGECAGRIVALGEGVTTLRVGQDVVAVAPGSMSTHLTASVHRVVPRPASFSAAQAAALPLAYVTAWYGLFHQARLRAGERVLIHSAASGTGWAAVQIARQLGAEVFATAGTPDKRAWLKAQGVAQVMDSRSVAFAAQVLAATDGQGVDVVLSSLSGAAIEASLSALAPDGRFIELGKSDIYADRPLGLARFKKSLSYTAIDLADLAERRPERVGALLREVMELLDAGSLPLLPVQSVPISQAAEAFAKMAQAQHIGKLVLTLDDPEVQIRTARAPGGAIRADSSYLVTGGLGGLGLSVAAWLAERGAGHLILVGRSGAASAEQQAAVAALAARGTRVTVARADVAQRNQLEPIFQEIAASGMPLRGVIHAAGLLDDGLLLQQTPRRLRTVMAPKVQGALHLHALTQKLPLDFFVLYASVAGLLGSPGQGNYAAANTFLDGLAHYRQAQGLPALSIDWGAFSEVGLAAAQQNRGARLSSRGIQSLTPAQGLLALQRLLEASVPQVGVVRLNLRQWAGFNQGAAASRRLSPLWQEQPGENGRPAGDRELLERLAAAKPDARIALLEDSLRAQASQVLRIPEGKLDVRAPLNSLGMDSLMGLELRNRIETVFGIKVSATFLWTYPTVSAMSQHLEGVLRKDVGAAESSVPEVDQSRASEAAALATVGALTDAEKDALLAEKLALLSDLVDE